MRAQGPMGTSACSLRITDVSPVSFITRIIMIAAQQKGAWPQQQEAPVNSQLPGGVALSLLNCPRRLRVWCASGCGCATASHGRWQRWVRFECKRWAVWIVSSPALKHSPPCTPRSRGALQ